MSDEHRVSRALCCRCGYRWVAVVPNDATAALECPACHAQWGIEFSPDDEEADDDDA